jgi:tripartite-type tricarboxylate transporter receptor subunit TctC
MTGTAVAEFPVRPIRFIVAAGPGSAPDINARLLASQLTNQLGQQVVVDNRPGAAQVIGTEMIARAAPDGYTIGYGTNTSLVTGRFMLAKLPYDPDMDLRMVAQLLFGYNVLVVTPSLAVKSVSNLVDYAKDRPGKLSFGSTGNGSSQHLSGELFNLMAGTQMLHVPYKASQGAVTDVIAGRVQIMFENIAPILPHVRIGRVRALGVTSLKRSPVIPELPTISEAGVPGFEIHTFTGVVVPTGVPKGIIALFNFEINKAIKMPALKERYAEIGYELVGGTPEHFAEQVKKETVKWADVIKRTGAKVE